MFSAFVIGIIPNVKFKYSTCNSFALFEKNRVEFIYIFFLNVSKLFLIEFLEFGLSYVAFQISVIIKLYNAISQLGFNVSDIHNSNFVLAPYLGLYLQADLEYKGN